MASTPPQPEPSEPVSDAPESTKLVQGELLQLIWHEPKAVARMRRQPSWRRILEELDEHPHDPALDDPVIDNDTIEVEDHRDTFEILTRAGAYGPQDIDALLAQGILSGGKFVAPLALFAGILHFPFDPLEELKATVTTARPCASADDTLAEAIQDASRFLETPNLLSAPEVTQAIIKRLRDAFRRVERIVSSHYLHDQTRRVLLERRHYQRCDLFGSEHIRALLFPIAEQAEAIPCYLPASLAGELPMFEQFRVRLIATVELAASQFEIHPAALRVVALGRVAEWPSSLALKGQGSKGQGLKGQGSKGQGSQGHGSKGQGSRG